MGRRAGRMVCPGWAFDWKCKVLINVCFGPKFQPDSKPGLMIVNLEFWHFDCRALVTAQRGFLRLLRSTFNRCTSCAPARSFSSVPNFSNADADRRGRIFSGSVSSLRVLRELRRGGGGPPPPTLFFFLFFYFHVVS